MRRIHGDTPEDRAQARSQRRVDRREADYMQRVQTATTPRRKLVAVCDYARAVADDLPADAVLRLGRRIADVTRETLEEEK